MVMRDIRASVEVRALIGASRLRELQGKASTRYECWQCGSQGRTTDATSVIVVSQGAGRYVKRARADREKEHSVEGAARMLGGGGGATAPPPNPPHHGRGGARSPRRRETRPQKRRPP